jgi:hypothetical protein
MLVLLAVLAIAAALLRRWACWQGTARTIEALVLVGAGLLALVGLLATGLAALGWFSAPALVFVLTAAAVLTWPWGQVASGEPERLPPPDPARVWFVAVGLVLATLALRIPAIPAELGGRDQGSYILRARHTLRTGAIDLIDPVLAAAGRELEQRPGPGDILSLYPPATGLDRAGRYEAAYRPGFYLSDRARGLVVPQFLHLHPSLLATCGLIFGPEHMALLLHLEALLSVLALWALGRRLLPRGPWALLAASLYLASPLTVWVHRTPLTEPLTGLLLLAAALALARGLRAGGDFTVLAALLLGTTAWVRGNAWLSAPLVLAILWLVPAGPHRRVAPACLFGLLVASLAVHVVTSFPYLHDELHRLLGALAPLSLTSVAITALLGAGLWLLGDRLLADQRGRIAHLPAALVLAAIIAVALYAFLAARGGGHSRLDPAGPLLGAFLLLAAAAGALRFARLRPLADPHAVWLLALASVPVLTLALYAPRNLPHATLYYYGRYLVPELLPVACLLAAHALSAVDRSLSARTGSTLARVATSGLALALLAAQLAPYLTHPITRLREFAGAERAIDALAAEIPADAIVIAGGEGWHSAHTFNQIGGALAIGRGRTVLPYRSQEATYAVLHELLIAGPRARDHVAPQVFLLLNEATHSYRPRGAGDRPLGPIAAIDDRLPAPFVAHPVALVELLVDRLTPVEGELPTRVTRADLRMALFAVRVDEALQSQLRTWHFRDGSPQGPVGLRITADTWNAGQLCLAPEQPLVLTLPRGQGPVSLVLVAGTDGPTGEGWEIVVDGRSLDLRPAAGAVARDTLGPYPLAVAPRRLTIRGSKKARLDRLCPHGSLAELRLLPPDSAGFAGAATPWARSFTPPADLGHPTTPITWVTGRSLSRARPGTSPTPVGGGLTLPLRPDQRLDFAATAVPGDSRAEHDLVVNLRDLELGAAARIQIWEDNRQIAELDPPDHHPGAWQSPPFPWRPRAPLAQLGLILVNADEQARVQLRDLALFDRRVVATSELSPASTSD